MMGADVQAVALMLHCQLAGHPLCGSVLEHEAVMPLKACRTLSGAHCDVGSSLVVLLSARIVALSSFCFSSVVDSRRHPERAASVTFLGPILNIATISYRLWHATGLSPYLGHK